MPSKSVILAIFAVTLGFGMLISGCNRDRKRTAMRPVERTAPGRIRPAEVLSASALRPPPRQAHYAPAPVSMAQVPLKVVPLPSAPPSVPYQHTLQPVMVHPTPELAMARASFTHTPPTSFTPPALTARQVRPLPGRAPIPELEPSMFRRPTTQASRPAPRAPIMMTQVSSDRREIQQALAPLSPAVVQPIPQQNWVASPTTAMRSYY